MPTRDNFKGLDKLAMHVACVDHVNTTAPVDRGALSVVMQHWTNQTNIAVIFCTILSTVSITLLTNYQGDYKLLVAAPFAIGAVWFAARAWAFGRCAAVATRLWL